MTGLDEFKRILLEFKKLSIWAAGTSVAFPFIASFVSIIPPWPQGLNIITSVVQLVALIIAYQLFRPGARRANRRVVTYGVLASLALLCYIFMFTMFTIYVPEAKRAIVIGFECSVDASKMYSDCPFLGLNELSNAAYDEFLLWTKSSIALARLSLIALWFAIFISIAFLIGHFLVHQMRRTVAR